MAEDPIKQQEEIFAQERQAFEQAQVRYLDACRKYDFFIGEEHLLNPPVTRAAYSDRTAWILAKLADLAYLPFEEQPEELARLELNLNSGSFELVETFVNADTQAFLVKAHSFAVLSFRGTQTNSIGDIKTDIKAGMLKTIDGKVHEGFLEAYALIADDINASVAKIGKLPIYITGHSLGAALATIATQALEKKFGEQIAACYTFGSPRVGNSEFDRSIKSPFYRIVNATDGVTLIPLMTMGGYTHVGDARYLTLDGDLRRGIPFFQRMWDIIVAILSSFLSSPWVIKPFISAHSMSEYIGKLEKIAENRNRS
jgi:triacylglycerol lipase